MCKITKSDWEVFKAYLPIWQESYIEKLNKEYISLLLGEENASSKFWKLKDRILNDAKCPGVVLNLNKNNMLLDIIALLKNGVITTNELNVFSKSVREAIELYCEMQIIH